MPLFEAHLYYALAWLSFALGHSLLAGETLKNRLGASLGAFYRLSYNLFALLHIALVVALGSLLLGGAAPYPFPPWAEAVLMTGYVLGWAAFLWALGGYDLGLLAGTRQIRDRFKGIGASGDEPLVVNGLHAWVRHPLYAAALPILWGRIADPFDLATAAWAAIYLFIGAWSEERKLLELYGAAYGAYRRRVPAFLPWKGRAA